MWPIMATHGFPLVYFPSAHITIWDILSVVSHTSWNYILCWPCDPSRSAPLSVRVSVQIDPTEFSAMIMKRVCLLLLNFCTSEKPLTFLPKEHSLYFLSCSPPISQKVNSPDHLLLFRSSVPIAVFQKSIHKNFFHLIPWNFFFNSLSQKSKGTS